MSRQQVVLVLALVREFDAMEKKELDRGRLLRRSSPLTVRTSTSHTSEEISCVEPIGFLCEAK